jgi:hypothetical protein
VALAVLALATAVLAYAAWRKQSREVRDQADMLQLQAGELRQVDAERKREEAERLRAQATQVYVWIAVVGIVDDSGKTSGMTVEAYVRNTSPQPIYAVFLAWHPTADNPKGVEETHEPLLMPGDEMKASAPEPSLAFRAHQEDVVVATFRDRDGVRWRADPDGRLQDFGGWRQRSASPAWSLTSLPCRLKARAARTVVAYAPNASAGRELSCTGWAGDRITLRAPR